MAHPDLGHRQLRDIVYDRLRSDIFSGRLKPGSWLRQEQIAEELGVSQMPVREAFKRLEAAGLVEHAPYRGVRVIGFSIEDLEDLYAMRATLEGRAARAAASTLTDAQLAELRRLHEQMLPLQSPEELERYREFNRQFHEIIVTAAGRPYLCRTILHLWEWFPTMLWSTIAATNAQPGRADADSAEHAAIIAALEARDATLAEQAMQRHIARAGDDLVAVLRASGAHNTTTLI